MTSEHNLEHPTNEPRTRAITGLALQPEESERGPVLLAAFLSPLLPGVGHLVVKRRGRAVLLLLIFSSLILSVCLLRLPLYRGMLILFFALITTLCIFATYDVAYGRTRTNKPSQWWLAILLPFALFAASGHTNWSILVAGFQPFEIPSQSMQNTVVMGDRILVDRWYYEKHPVRDGDIAIMLNGEGLYVIKRIMASGGETIEGRNGKVFVNGTLVKEPYVIDAGFATPESKNFGPIIVPAGKLFVMGDSRNNSLDSRYPQFGLPDVSSLRGKPLYTVRSRRHGAFQPLK